MRIKLDFPRKHLDACLAKRKSSVMLLRIIHATGVLSKLSS